MKKMIKGLIKKSYQRLKRSVGNSPRKFVGLKKSEYRRLKSFPQNHQALYDTLFFNRPIKFTSPFWFLHSVTEIYIDQVYRFPQHGKKMKIIDCGANIGLSVLYMKNNNPNAEIIAIEADPNIYKLLKHNVEVYNYTGIELVNAAVWKADEMLSFSAEGSVGGKIDSDGGGKVVQIPAVRLRNYLQEPVDFLKMDIEGAEYEVLKDCKDLLVNVDNLFIEFHGTIGEPQKFHEILDWVDKAGFRYYIKEAWNNMSHPFLKTYNDFYHLQINLFCFREH